MESVRAFRALTGFLTLLSKGGKMELMKTNTQWPEELEV